jgi:hypothetical protein
VIRFRFSLRPLPDVVPWGGDHPRLHWFGLTDGWYWIEVGGHELLRYSDRTLERWALADGGVGAEMPYADYYAVRLWEDVLEMVGQLTEPVPPDLVGFVSGELPDWPDEDVSPDAEEAVIWHSRHSMYMGPLTNAPRIRFWRTVVDGCDTVTVAWKHQGESDIEFAAPVSGRIVVPTGSFDTAVSAFDRELLAGMEERVAELEASGPPPGVALDLEQLRREQHDRARWLPRARARQVGTDWAVVRAGARELAELGGGAQPEPRPETRTEPQLDGPS